MSEPNEPSFANNFNQPEIHDYRNPVVIGTPPPRISEAKLAANRRNAALSRGPVSAEGKRRSSLNALRSNTHGQIVCLPAEELAVALQQTSEVRTELAPIGPIENYLATSIAENMWRISRIRAIEGGIFASGFRLNIEEIDAGHPEVNAALASSETWLQQAHKLMLLSTYETRLASLIRKDRADLAALQSTRTEAYQKAMNEAEIFVEYAESKGETYDPGEDFTPAAEYGGFVFSASAVALRRDRKIRFEAASTYRNSAKSRKPDPDSGPKGSLKSRLTPHESILKTSIRETQMQPQPKVSPNSNSSALISASLRLCVERPVPPLRRPPSASPRSPKCPRSRFPKYSMLYPEVV